MTLFSLFFRLSSKFFSGFLIIVLSSLYGDQYDCVTLIRHRSTRFFLCLNICNNQSEQLYQLSATNLCKLAMKQQQH